MLNEGYALYKSLERCGIRLTPRHPDVKEPGKKDGLIVGLDKKGRVARIEYRKAEDVSKLWTTREGMHNSFPVLKLQRPLWKLGQNDPLRKQLNDPKKDETEKRKLLKRQDRKLNITSDETKWWKRLQERVTKLRPFFETTIQDHKALPQLMNRFLLAAKVDDFAQELFKRLKQVQNEVPYTLFENILIGNIWYEKKKEYRAEVPLILDVSDWDDKTKYSNRVASPRFEAFVNECMFKMQDSLTKQKNNNIPSLSALSGENLLLEDDKFPCPNLPIIGNTYLFSVADHTPCQTRYKQSSTDIIPVGRKEANAIQDSLNWITDDERKGKTWYPIPGLNDGESDLLIVYLDGKPNLSVNKAYLLGGVSKNDFSENTYEAISSVAINALKGENILKANELIRIFALRKADPGRTQVSLQRVYTISELIRSDETWREAAKNIPNVSMPFFRKEIEKTIVKQGNISVSISQFLADRESKVTFLSPRCPFPADLVRLTQKQWIRFGEDVSSLTGVSLGDVYDVFFAQENEQRNLIEKLLSTTLQRAQSLLIGLGQAEQKKEMKGFTSESRFTLLTTISAFAIYLHKLGIKKEEYMKDTFFYVGRFLSLIDTLHLEYCKNVRGGNIPPQLLGNAHLQVALDNPVSAFDLLSRRIGIYQAWTRKEQGDKIKLARWAVGQIGKVSDLLAEKTLPTSTASAERAQILLGYLARSEEIPQDENK
jgi:hypothetical protein